jgi:hypothetical protein
MNPTYPTDEIHHDTRFVNRKYATLTRDKERKGKRQGKQNKPVQTKNNN